MERLYFWPTNPAASLFTLWILSQVFLYAARVPVHRALREVGRLLGGVFRIGARWCRGLAGVAARRDHEMIVEMGKGDTEAKIGREFHRIEGAFAKELARYPDLHRKLDDVVTKVDADFQECATAAPAAPGWTEAVAAVAKLPPNMDSTVKKVMEEIQKSAVAGEKKALQEFREATAKKHKILSSMAPGLEGAAEARHRRRPGGDRRAGGHEAHRWLHDPVREGPRSRVESGPGAGLERDAAVRRLAPRHGGGAGRRVRELQPDRAADERAGAFGQPHRRHARRHGGGAGGGADGDRRRRLRDGDAGDHQLLPQAGAAAQVAPAHHPGGGAGRPLHARLHRSLAGRAPRADRRVVHGAARLRWRASTRRRLRRRRARGSRWWARRCSGSSSPGSWRWWRCRWRR